MHERHPVEKSPPYHVAIWIIAGLVAVAIVYGMVRQANEPPAQLPSRPAAQPDE
jgi:hypothetical protein